MDKHILVNVDGHCFVGSFYGYRENRLYLKQSEKSQIIVSMPLENCEYLIDISGSKYTTKKEILGIVNQMQSVTPDATYY